MDVVPRLRLNVSEVDKGMVLDPFRSLAYVCHCVDSFLRMWVLGLVFFMVGQGYLSVDVAFRGSLE